MRVVRDFSYRRYKFHISDNRAGISKANYDLFPRYKLLMYDGDNKWINIGCVSTKQEGRALARSYYIDVLQYNCKRPGE